MDEMDNGSNVFEIRRDHLPSFRFRRKDDTEQRICVWDRRIAELKDRNFLPVCDSLIEAATSPVEKRAVDWKGLLSLGLAFLCAFPGC